MEFLTQQESTTLRAAIDRIIPADDYPGGWEAGVGDYLARQFQGDLAPYVPTYRALLDALDQEARAAENRGFAELPASLQDALLERVAAGNVVAAWQVDPVTSFAMLVEHTAEGYYSDPANGGNRDGIAWRMIGFEVCG
jgi:hypothetical protein